MFNKEIQEAVAAVISWYKKISILFAHVTMLLILIRHGIAEDFPKKGATDAERALTDEGIRKIERAGSFLKALDLRVIRILSSPLRRAIQTAEVLVAKCASEVSVELESSLRPDSSVEEAIREISRHSRQHDFQQGEALIAVSHQPLISTLGAKLLGLSGVQVGFGRGAILALEFDGPPASGRARLLWAVTPKIYCME